MAWTTCEQQPMEASASGSTSASAGGVSTPKDQENHQQSQEQQAHDIVASRMSAEASPTTSNPSSNRSSSGGTGALESNASASGGVAQELEQLRVRVSQQDRDIAKLLECHAQRQSEHSQLHQGVLSLQQDLMCLMNIVELQMQVPSHPLSVPWNHLSSNLSLHGHGPTLSHVQPQHAVWSQQQLPQQQKPSGVHEMGSALDGMEWSGLQARTPLEIHQNNPSRAVVAERFI